MNAKFKPEDATSDELIPTLGSLLYTRCKPRVSEDEWVALVRATAVRDTNAYGTLYMMSHGLVFALMVRILGNRDLAEDLTVEVFQDVWREAANYDSERGPVLAWILNLARSRAVARTSGGNDPA